MTSVVLLTPQKQHENDELCNDDRLAKLEGRRIVDLKHIFNLYSLYNTWDLIVHLEI